MGLETHREFKTFVIYLEEKLRFSFSPGNQGNDLFFFFYSCKFSFGYNCFLAADYSGRSGWLAIMWKMEIEFKVLYLSYSVIHG